MVSESELEVELDYFQIPSSVNCFDYDLAHEKGAKFLNKFIGLIESIIFANIGILEETIQIRFYEDESDERICTNFEILDDITKAEFVRFENYFGHKILRKFGKQIVNHLEPVFLVMLNSCKAGNRYTTIYVNSCVDFDQIARLSRMTTNKTK
ncbi:22814_t:CDS:1 [Cetraspora pellucida]|uniref:22814_t:CDS:1 n=1 Tax=Cetraspora pellucida TaxID=1433469 RepID=A0A9N8ZRZ0_9GLOM|nr:22814_t:CDS:1 [Cetraspora pellucida]